MDKLYVNRSTFLSADSNNIQEIFKSLNFQFGNCFDCSGCSRCSIAEPLQIPYLLLLICLQVKKDSFKYNSADLLLITAQIPLSVTYWQLQLILIATGR